MGKGYKPPDHLPRPQCAEQRGAAACSASRLRRQACFERRRRHAGARHRSMQRGAPAARREPLAGATRQGRQGRWRRAIRWRSPAAVERALQRLQSSSRLAQQVADRQRPWSRGRSHGIAQLRRVLSQPAQHGPMTIAHPSRRAALDRQHGGQVVSSVGRNQEAPAGCAARKPSIDSTRRQRTNRRVAPAVARAPHPCVSYGSRRQR